MDFVCVGHFPCIPYSMRASCSAQYQHDTHTERYRRTHLQLCTRVRSPVDRTNSIIKYLKERCARNDGNGVQLTHWGNFELKLLSNGLASVERMPTMVCWCKQSERYSIVPDRSTTTKRQFCKCANLNNVCWTRNSILRKEKSIETDIMRRRMKKVTKKNQLELIRYPALKLCIFPFRLFTCFRWLHFRLCFVCTRSLSWSSARTRVERALIVSFLAWYG